MQSYTRVHVEALRQTDEECEQWIPASMGCEAKEPSLRDQDTPATPDCHVLPLSFGMATHPRNPPGTRPTKATQQHYPYANSSNAIIEGTYKNQNQFSK